MASQTPSLGVLPVNAFLPAFPALIALGIGIAIGIFAMAALSIMDERG